MTFDNLVINLGPSTSTASVRAYTAVRLSSDAISSTLYGLSVIKAEGKPPWVTLPQNPGKNAKKYFPVVEADGKRKEEIIKPVLDAYIVSKN